MPKPSVVNVSQIFTVDKRHLGERVGALSAHRVRQIINGVRLLLEPQSVEDEDL